MRGTERAVKAELFAGLEFSAAHAHESFRFKKVQYCTRRFAAE